MFICTHILLQEKQRNADSSEQRALLEVAGYMLVLCVCICMCLCVCMRVCAYVCVVCVRARVCTRVFVCVSVCVSMCMYVCMCVYIHTVNRIMIMIIVYNIAIHYKENLIVH